MNKITTLFILLMLTLMAACGPMATEMPSTVTAFPTDMPSNTEMPSVTETTAPATTSGLPTPLGDPLEHQPQWDLIAQQVTQLVGITTFDYDLFQLPANSTWDATLAHYQTEAAAAGWGDAPTSTNEMAGGHYAVWSMTNADGTTSYFVVAQVDTAEGTFTLNITGNP